MTELTLPGLTCEPIPSPYRPRAVVFVGDLYSFPDAVSHGMRQELERLQAAGIPAFAEQRRIRTPNGGLVIGFDGRASAWAVSGTGFAAEAQHAALRMENSTVYSFNGLFAQLYLKEESHA